MSKTRPDHKVEPSGEEGASARPFVLAEFTPYRLVALGRMMSQRLAKAYANENLTIPEWRVLAVISQADAMAARDVTAKTPMDKMAVSRAVASLEEKSFVARKTDPHDGRVSILMLSAEGRRVFDRVAAIAVDYEDALLSGLNTEERRNLSDTLTSLETHDSVRFDEPGDSEAM